MKDEMKRKIILKNSTKEPLLNASEKVMLESNIEILLGSASNSTYFFKFKPVIDYVSRNSTVTFLIDSPGYFTDGSGTLNYGQSKSYGGTNSYDVYYKLPSGESATLTIQDGLLSTGWFLTYYLYAPLTCPYEISEFPIYASDFRAVQSYGNFPTTLPSVLKTIQLEFHGPITYTSGTTWPTTLTIALFSANTAMTATEVDNILIDIYTAFLADTAAADGLIVAITGSNPARTSASNTAVTALEGWGATITTN